MGVIKMEFTLIIAAVIFLVIVIVSGRFLAEINLSKCKTDPNIITAHWWAAWAVGISTAGLAIAVGLFILILVI